ncbi:MAG: type II secretion system protein [Rickettsiales bacterium]
MLLPPRCRPFVKARSGFSLIELSVVVAILGVVATLGLEVASTFVKRNAVNDTRARLQTVDQAIADFFKVYGRLPCPAVINAIAPSAATYGLEDCSLLIAGTTIGGGVRGGAVPYRTLNLPMSASLDGFNNRIWYHVTANLTAAGGSSTVANRFASIPPLLATQQGIGGIEVRTGVQSILCTAGNCQKIADPAAATPSGAAYILISAGPDGRGAFNIRGLNKASCASASGSDARVDTQNCVFGSNAVRLNMSITTIPYNAFYDNRFNPGSNLASYFDDIVVWRTKNKL